VSKRRTPFAVAAVSAAVAVAGCGGASDESGGAAATASSGGSGPTLSLVAYSTPKGVYDQVIPAFAKTSAGRGVRFNESFGASGEQSRAVASGQPADVVAFSLAPDVDKLVKAGLVPRDWTAAPHRGFVSDSVVVLMVRKGNPKHIAGWTDLVRPGVQVLTPNPFTSGGAKWNLLAAYGAQLEEGRSPAQALAYVRTLLTQHVKVQDKSGRESVQNFLGGNGDVAISYENEAITAQQKGAKVDYVIPRDTILIENPVAVTKAAKPQAKAFLSYLWTAPAQQTFARHGYRPVDGAVSKQFASRFPTPARVFTIAYLGGWSAVDKSIFDPQSGSVAEIEQDTGASTGK
jgi:sulfate/thiosulfate transport system substrate-binding protein